MIPKNLQGRVQFPTGGDSPRDLKGFDLVKFQNRRYSPDERRKNTLFSVP